MIKAQMTPRRRLRAKVAGDAVSGTLNLQTKVVIPSSKRQYLRPSEGYNGFDTVIVEGVPDASIVTFSPEQIIPDELYTIGYNWFAQVVERVQPMVGTKRNMTPAEILYWLKRVKYIPQGWANSEVSLDLYAGAVGRRPAVVKSTATSTITLDIESYAVGVLREG